MLSKSIIERNNKQYDVARNLGKTRQKKKKGVKRTKFQDFLIEFSLMKATKNIYFWIISFLKFLSNNITPWKKKLEKALNP